MRISTPVLPLLAALGACLVLAGPAQAGATQCHNRPVSTAGDAAHGIPPEAFLLRWTKNMTCGKAAAILAAWPLGIGRGSAPGGLECKFFPVPRKKAAWVCSKWVGRHLRAMSFKRAP